MSHPEHTPGEPCPAGHDEDTVCDLCSPIVTITPDPTYPPEFEALDAAFASALKAAEGDVGLANKLADITSSMYTVAERVRGKAKYDADCVGVEPLKAERRVGGQPGFQMGVDNIGDADDKGNACEHRRDKGTEDVEFYVCDLTRDKPCDDAMHDICEGRKEART